MKRMSNRRRFLASSALAALTGVAGRQTSASSSGSGRFSFILLGDLHFDRWEHHDLAWLKRHKGDDLRQIENYTRLTREVMPLVFNGLRERITALRQGDAPPAFILQVGDLVEGLCGGEELAARQNREAIEFIAEADLELPFLFTKGNHDVTGDGAAAAFKQVFEPFMVEQARLLDSASTHHRANYVLRCGAAQFAFFDAYDKDSLEWLEAVAQQCSAPHFFVIAHPPAVPYGARATWHLFAGDKTRREREKLLALLGDHEAVVLGGHLHKYAALTRRAGRGRFTQLALSSVISAMDQKPGTSLSGIHHYNGDQVELMPNYAPETKPERRAVYETEKSMVSSFAYADTAGYAVVEVAKGGVKAAFYSGLADEPFQVVAHPS